jgi:hypothetical protein
MFVLLGKLSVSVFLVACSVAVARWRDPLRTLAPRLPSAGLLCAGYLMARIAGLWIVHKGLGIAMPSDVPGYFEHALRVGGGEVPNREFSTPYGFLFNYLMAASVTIWRDPFSILVMLQIAECLGLYLLIRAVVAATGDRRDGALLLLVYATNPIVALNLWLGGQDESMLTLVLGSAAVLATSTRRWLVMGLPAMLFVASKLFSAWILAPLALSRSWWDRLGMAAGLAACLTFIKLSGAALFSFEFSRQQGSADQLGSAQTSGNLWYLMTQITPAPLPSYVSTGLTLTALLLVGVWLWLRADRVPALWLVLVGTALFGLCFQVTFRMTSSPYLAPCVAALAAVLVMRHGSTAALAAWSGLWSFEGTLWYRLRDLLPGSAVMRVVFDLYEVVLVGSTIFVLVWTLTLLSRLGKPVRDTPLLA